MKTTGREKMNFFKKTDIIVIAVIIVASAVIWLVYNSIFAGKTARAEIYYYSKMVQTLDLTAGTEKIFSIAENDEVVFKLDKEGNIQFIKSDCPDKVCIRSGKLHMVGQSAACLPNGIVIKIVPRGERSEDDLDIVVGR